MSIRIHGLEFFDCHLYAIQNGFSEGDNFRQLILNETQDQILEFEEIDNDSNRLDDPLTFCITNDHAIVIGNSNLKYLLSEDQLRFDTDTIPNTKLQVYKLD